MKKNYLFFLILFCFASLWSEWTVVQTFTIPGKASGLAWDGTYLYSGIYGSNGSDVYRIDPNDGTYQLQFSDPELDDTYGMTYDGNNLWIGDHRTGISDPAIAYKYDMSGNIIDQFNLIDHYMSGLTYDNGDFWAATYYPDDPAIIYKVDTSSNILHQFNFDLPDNDDEQPWDITLENGDMWIAEYYENMLYKVDTSDGTILESHSSENVKPSGITFDGTYLWYVDGPLNSDATLYKVDLSGAGTPAILLGWDEYDFGNTVIGQPASVDLAISNTGTADLIIDELDFSLDEFYSDVTLPLTISVGNSEDITIFFDPTNVGQYDATLYIDSNDPVNPNEEVLLSGYGITEDPQIMVSPNSLNFGNIRVNATSGKFVSLSNQGSGTLEVNEIEFDITQFYLDPTVELPLNLTPTEEIAIRIWFNPDAAQNFDGAMTIHSNDPITPMVDVVLNGDGDDSQYPIGSVLWQHQITTGYDNSPKAIAQIPDVTEDGINDVIICSEDHFIRCFNGNSSNSADIIWEVEIPGNVFDHDCITIIPDIDNDDYSDLVIGTGGGDKAVRAMSGKTGELLWAYFTNQFGDGGTVYQVDSKRDFNSDGIRDVLAATGDDATGTGPERTFLIDGSNGSVIWDFVGNGGPKFSCITIEDVNSDNIPEVLSGASNFNETEGLVYCIDGASGSEIWQFTTAGSSVWALSTIDDVNGDNIDDVVAGDFAGNYYAFDATNGSSLYTGSCGACIILNLEKMNDVNNDGKSDIAVAHSSNTNAIVFDGFTGQTIWLHPVADQPWVIDKIEDVSGDGINDLIVGTLYSNNYAYFLDGTDGSELGSLPVGTPVDAIAAIEDVSNDNSWEMVLGGRDGTVMCVSGGQAASTGTLLGDITLIGGNGNVENAEISCNGYTVNPDATGYFEMILPAGTYDVTAECDGYQPTTINNVEIISGLITSINIGLNYLYPPENLEASIDENNVTLTWEEPAAIPTSYKVYRNDEFIEEVTELTHTDINLPAGTYQYFVTAMYNDLESDPSNTIDVAITDADNPVIPLVTKLVGNYPNPFNPTTNIKFSLKDAGEVSLVIYNVKGKKVKTLIKGSLEPDFYDVLWDGKDDSGKSVSSGVYFYKLKTDKIIQVKKAILIK